MKPTELHDAALTLENDGKFYKDYREFCNSGTSHSLVPARRRNKIKDALNRLSVDEGETADREQLRRYFDDLYGLPAYRDIESDYRLREPTIQFWLDDVKYPAAKASHRKTDSRIPHDCLNPEALSNLLTNQETAMNSVPIVVTQQTLLNGKPIDQLDDSTVFDVIRTQEKEIEQLQAIKAQPKRLLAEIAKRQAGIDALVAYLDAKGAATTPAAAV